MVSEKTFFLVGIAVCQYDPIVCFMGLGRTVQNAVSDQGLHSLHTKCAFKN